MERTNISNVNTQSQTAATKPAKPNIKIVGGQLPEIVDQAEHAILAKGYLIYQRGGMLVKALVTATPVLRGIKRPEGALAIQQLEIPYLIEMFTKAANWLKFDARKNDWREMDCPKAVAETYLARGTWKVPVLTGIIESPTLRPDGTILEKTGYDKETGLLFYPGGTKFPKMKEQPTKEDALQALEKFHHLLKGFPFVENIDFAVAMSAILTALIRRSIRTAPLHSFSAPKMGSGKSLLADVVAMIATGRVCSVMSQADSPEEEKKRFLAILMEGDPVVCIDNIERPLASDSLCSILTQEIWKERMLGKNRTMSVPTNITFLATGNNLTFQGDLSTRSLVCMLDPECERPEERSFEVNLYDHIPENRGELVKDGLTILRAYFVAGCPKQDIANFGRFEKWSDLVRSSLVWLGLADPCESRKRVENADPIRANLRALLTNWYAAIKPAATLKEVVQIAKQKGNEALYDALTEFAGEKQGEINQRQLGHKLKSLQGRIEGGMKLEQHGKRQGFILWKINNIEQK